MVKTKVKSQWVRRGRFSEVGMLLSILGNVFLYLLLNEGVLHVQLSVSGQVKITGRSLGLIKNQRVT